MTDRLFGCAFVAENEAKNDAGINNRAATYANGHAEEKEAFASLAHIFKRYGDKTVRWRFIAGKFCVFSANPAEERPLF